ncbi:hypothetical protein ACQ4M4_03530 [Leptolyngbya sp. AN02str]|uniref:hypothetical protein n=1 Tax=Leptolyngbya sp. AN02str TaxID=3423363 RepID=UPI003D312954
MNRDREGRSQPIGRKSVTNAVAAMPMGGGGSGYQYSSSREVDLFSLVRSRVINNQT